MKPSAFTFLASLMCLITCISCIEDVNIDSGEVLPSVVECILKKEPVQSLRLYQMMPLSSDKTIPVENAEISLTKFYGNMEIPVATFSKKEGDLWEAEYEPEFGVLYKLQAIVNGKDTLSATTKFPEDLRLVTYAKMVRNSVEDIPEMTVDSVSFYYRTCEVHYGHMQEPFQNQYGQGFMSHGPNGSFKAYKRPYQGACKIWVYPHKNITRTGHYPMTYLEEDSYSFQGTDQPYTSFAVTDHPGADNFNIVPGKLSDLDICKLTQREMAFMKSLPKFRYHFFDFWYTLKCPDLALHDRFIRIDHPKNFTNGLSEKDLENSYQYSNRSFLITADYDPSYPAYTSFFYTYWPEESNAFVNEVRFLSDEYDAFLRDIISRGMNSDNFVLSELDRNNITSNIEGGFGIFGAQHITWEQREKATTLYAN